MSPAAPQTAAPAVAGIGRRLVSMLYESLVVLAVVFFSAFAFYGAALGQLSGVTRHVFQVYLLCVLGIYFVASWTRKGGTLPMQTWRIRLTGADGGKLRPGRALLRYVLAWPSVTIFGIGILWAFFDRDRQFLHDRLAGTLIVKAEP